MRLTPLPGWGRAQWLAASLLAAALVFVPAFAEAVEVIWLEPAPPDQVARVAALAQARRGPLDHAQFRALLTRETRRDQQAIVELARVREEVRAHEAVLDGELQIMEALERALSDIRLVRNEEDRETVISALLYQGFAVDRFWGQTLGEASEAAPYRLTIDDRVVERPWVDAFGMDPMRKASAEDIGEAPSREAYDALRRVLAVGLQARVLAPDLPPGAVLRVDGRAVEVDDTLIIELLPGLHYLQVELDEEIIASEVVRLQPGQRFELELPLQEAAWQQVVKAARSGQGLTPAALLPFLDALGGEVWVAQGSGADLRISQITPQRIEPVAVPIAGTVSRPGPGRFGHVSLEGWAGGGLLYSRDFEQPPPAGEAGRPLALAPAVGLALAWDRAWIRYGLGVELHAPLGPSQIARSGPSTHRIRAMPYALLGHSLFQVTYGYLTPHHWVGGAQAVWPISGDPLLDDLLIEVRGGLRLGSPPALDRADGSMWQGRSIVQAFVGFGVRLKPRD